MINSKLSILGKIKCWMLSLAFFVLILSSVGYGQPPMSITKLYISRFANEAIDQMIEYKIPASIILAQAILESKSGHSFLARKSNNHFGIKCHVEWGGDTVCKNDENANECFRRYNKIKDSYTDHSLFLRSRPRYSGLFKLAITDYKGWCYGLKNYGYATYTCYTEELLGIIEKYQLYALDGFENLIALNKSSLEYEANKETEESKLSLIGFTLKEVIESDIFWLNDRDLIQQDLDVLIKEPEVEVKNETSNMIADK